MNWTAITHKAWDLWAMPPLAVMDWKERRFPDIRLAWIRARKRELRRLHGDDRGVEWYLFGAYEAACDDWRRAQHRSWLGLRHRLNLAADWLIIALGLAWMFWPVLAVIVWLAGHVTVAVGWR